MVSGRTNIRMGPGVGAFLSPSSGLMLVPGPVEGPRFYHTLPLWLYWPFR